MTAHASAGDLPFPDTSFNLVTCRLAAHHFPDPERFVREAARVLIPGGIFALVDNVSPDDADLALGYNRFEKLRDPSHGRALGLGEWQSVIREAGLTLTASEVMDQDIPFEPWVTHMRCAPATVARLREQLEAEPLRGLLRPREDGDGLVFSLREAIVLARKPA